MRTRTVKNPAIHQENPRAAAVKRIMNIAQLIRQKGEPDEASEALEWEKQLANRLEEIQKEPASMAA